MNGILSNINLDPIAKLYGDEAGIKDYEFTKVMKRFEAKTAPAEEPEEDDADGSSSGVE